MPSDHPVFALSDRFVTDVAAVRPMDATFDGVAGHDHRWGDLGPDGIAAHRDLLAATRRALHALPPPDDRWSDLAVRVLDDELALQLDAHDHDEPLRDVAHLASTVPELLEALELQPVDTAEERDAVRARLEGLGEALDGWCATVRRGRDHGLTPAARQVRSVIDHLQAMAAPDGGLDQVADRVAASDPGHARPDAAVAAARTAAARTAATLTAELLPHAPVEDAIGRERYARLARAHLGTDVDLDETYAWGQQRVRDLRARAREVAARIDPDTDLLGVVARLRTDPGRSARDPQTFRELMLDRQRLALELLDGVHVDVPAAIREVDVRIAAGGALGARYTPPSEDLVRPGTIWWTLDGDGPVPLWEEVSTAYHEGFPGHHLQIGTQVGLTERLSRAHRVSIWNPGYGEGWALYAEQLMDELGFLEDPAYELGYLAAELLRATRVVVDIGLHLGLSVPDASGADGDGRWSFDRAVAALERDALLAPAYATSEVTRYGGWPGQAISYAVGQRVIVELREARRARDGAAFDLPAFHADVLGSGPVGLDLLRALVLDPGTAP